MQGIQVSKVNLSFEARDVKSSELFSLSNCFLVLSQLEIDHSWSRIGQTECILDYVTPQFTRTISVYYYPTSTTSSTFPQNQFRLALYHTHKNDFDLSSHKFIGQYEFNLRDILPHNGITAQLLDEEMKPLKFGTVTIIANIINNDLRSIIPAYPTHLQTRPTQYHNDTNTTNGKQRRPSVHDVHTMLLQPIQQQSTIDTTLQSQPNQHQPHHKRQLSKPSLSQSHSQQPQSILPSKALVQIECDGIETGENMFFQVLRADKPIAIYQSQILSIHQPTSVPLLPQEDIHVATISAPGQTTTQSKPTKKKQDKNKAIHFASFQLDLEALRQLTPTPVMKQGGISEKNDTSNTPNNISQSVPIRKRGLSIVTPSSRPLTLPPESQTEAIFSPRPIDESHSQIDCNVIQQQQCETRSKSNSIDKKQHNYDTNSHPQPSIDASVSKHHRKASSTFTFNTAISNEQELSVVKQDISLQGTTINNEHSSSSISQHPQQQKDDSNSMSPPSQSQTISSTQQPIQSQSHITHKRNHSCSLNPSLPPHEHHTALDHNEDCVIRLMRFKGENTHELHIYSQIRIPISTFYKTKHLNEPISNTNPLEFTLYNRHKTREKGKILITLLDPSYTFNFADFLITESIKPKFTVAIDFSGQNNHGYNTIDSGHYVKTLPQVSMNLTGSKGSSIVLSEADRINLQYEAYEQRKRDGEIEVDDMDWSRNAFIKGIQEVVQPIILNLAGGAALASNKLSKSTPAPTTSSLPTENGFQSTQPIPKPIPKATNIRIPIRTFGFSGKYDNGEMIDEPITQAFPLSLFNDTEFAYGIDGLIEQYKECRLSMEPPTMFHSLGGVIQTMVHSISSTIPIDHSVPLTQHHNRHKRSGSTSSQYHNGKHQCNKHEEIVLEQLTTTEQQLVIAKERRQSVSIITQNQNQSYENTMIRRNSQPYALRSPRLCDGNHPSFHICFILTDQPHTLANPKHIYDSLHISSSILQLPLCIICISLQTYSIASISKFDPINPSIRPLPIPHRPIISTFHKPNDPISLFSSLIDDDHKHDVSFFTPMFSIVNWRPFHNIVLEAWDQISQHGMHYYASKRAYPKQLSQKYLEMKQQEAYTQFVHESNRKLMNNTNTNNNHNNNNNNNNNNGHNGHDNIKIKNGRFLDGSHSQPINNVVSPTTLRAADEEELVGPTFVRLPKHDNNEQQPHIQNNNNNNIQQPEPSSETIAFEDLLQPFTIQQPLGSSSSAHSAHSTISNSSLQQYNLSIHPNHSAMFAPSPRHNTSQSPRHRNPSIQSPPENTNTIVYNNNHDQIITQQRRRSISRCSSTGSTSRIDVPIPANDPTRDDVNVKSPLQLHPSAQQQDQQRNVRLNPHHVPNMFDSAVPPTSDGNYGGPLQRILSDDGFRMSRIFSFDNSQYQNSNSKQ